MKETTLLQTVQRLDKSELLRYGSNLGMELEEGMNVDEMRQAYTDYVLSHPQELLIQLPKSDLDVINRARKAPSGNYPVVLDLHLTPIMVLYGLADADPPYEDTIGIRIPDDLQKVLFPHIQSALNDRNNQLRMSVEMAIEGLANVVGIVGHEEVIDLLKVVAGNKSEEEMQKLLNTVRQYSLLLDSMEWAEDGTQAADEDLLFVSRFGWEDTAKMKHYIEAHSSDIPDMPEMDVKDVALASSALVPVIPNERGKDFMHYLTTDLGFDQSKAYLICFNLWYFKCRNSEHDDGDEPLELYFLSNVLGTMEKEPTDEQAEEAMTLMADYVDHLPLWHRAGHTAIEYPSDAFVRRLTTKEPLGPMIRKLRKEARRMTDLLNGKAPISEALAAHPTAKNPNIIKKVGRNDPCPCGSGLKYKKCCGKL